MCFFLESVPREAMVSWFRCWISNPVVPSSKTLCDCKVDSSFHPSNFDQAVSGAPGDMVVESKLSPCSGLSDCNWTRTHNHVVHKRTLNHLAKLAKWLSVHLWTKGLWVQVLLQSLKITLILENLWVYSSD